jgi:hypothetical protein
MYSHIFTYVDIVDTWRRHWQSYIVLTLYAYHRLVDCAQAIHIHPYYVAVNLVEVARVFVGEWNHALEATYGRTMQQNWMNYRVDPSRFTVAWKDTVMEAGAASVSSLVTKLLSPDTQ